MILLLKKQRIPIKTRERKIKIQPTNNNHPTGDREAIHLSGKKIMKIRKNQRKMQILKIRAKKPILMLFF